MIIIRKLIFIPHVYKIGYEKLIKLQERIKKKRNCLISETSLLLKIKTLLKNKSNKNFKEFVSVGTLEKKPCSCKQAHD